MKIVTDDVIRKDLPLLFSEDSMKTARTVLCFASDSVEMFVKCIHLQFMSSGHYMICLKDYTNKIIKYFLILFPLLKKIARKLHLQFGHAVNEKVIKLLKGAGETDKDLFKCVEDAESNCDICKHYSKPKLHPVVGFFNGL